MNFDKDIYYQTHTNGYTKIITFNDKSIEKVDRENDTHTPTSVNIEIKSLGISMIGELEDEKTGKMNWKELAYCNATGI